MPGLLGFFISLNRADISLASLVKDHSKLAIFPAKAIGGQQQVVRLAFIPLIASHQYHVFIADYLVDFMNNTRAGVMGEDILPTGNDFLPPRTLKGTL